GGLAGPAVRRGIVVLPCPVGDDDGPLPARLRRLPDLPAAERDDEGRGVSANTPGEAPGVSFLAMGEPRRPSGQQAAGRAGRLGGGPVEALARDGQFLPRGLAPLIGAAEGDDDTVGEDSHYPYGVRANAHLLPGRPFDLNHPGTLLVDLIPRRKVP